MRGKVFVAIGVAALLVGATAASGLTKVHESTEVYYEAGTQVVVAQGGEDFVVGDFSGDALWEVIEKGWWDADNNTTIISYTVGNDSFVDPITSFHVPAPVDPILPVNSPAGWTSSVIGGEIIWATDDPAFGIEITQTLDTMIVTYPGQLVIDWAPGAVVDFADGTVLRHPDWSVSVPEPAIFSLLGLSGTVALLRRRR